MKKKYIIFQLYDDVCALDVDDIHEIVELDSMVKTSSKELNLCFWKRVTVPVEFG
jgi:chemotaxis signal transduction protein